MGDELRWYDWNSGNMELESAQNEKKAQAIESESRPQTRGATFALPHYAVGGVRPGKRG